MKSILIAFLLFVSASVVAQSPFKSIPKPAMRYSLTLNSIIRPDSNINAVRFSITPVSYSYPNNHVMVGAGVAYENLSYNFGTEKWTTNWSAGCYGWYNTVLPTSKTTKQLPISYGPAATFLNGILLIGVGYDGANWGAILGASIPLN